VTILRAEPTLGVGGWVGEVELRRRGRRGTVHLHLVGAARGVRCRRRHQALEDRTWVVVKVLESVCELGQRVRRLLSRPVAAVHIVASWVGWRVS
jgi:hypothetical protein